MSAYDELPPGKSAPEDIYVVVEIPQGGWVKYELDHEKGIIFVDRFLFTPMHYPANYGYIPQTLAEDGDPLDALVLSRAPVYPGTVIRARPVGVLIMEDEKGKDEKIIAVPVDKLDPAWSKVKDITDVPEAILNEIKHFFEHYKDNEPGKWAKVREFKDAAAAKKLIEEAIERFRSEHE